MRRCRIGCILSERVEMGAWTRNHEVKLGGSEVLSSLRKRQISRLVVHCSPQIARCVSAFDGAYLLCMCMRAIFVVDPTATTSRACFCCEPPLQFDGLGLHNQNALLNARGCHSVLFGDTIYRLGTEPIPLPSYSHVR